MRNELLAELLAEELPPLDEENEVCINMLYELGVDRMRAKRILEAKERDGFYVSHMARTAKGQKVRAYRKAKPAD